MSQLAYKFQDKFGKTVHKIIFVSPSDEEGKYIEICQRYFSPKKTEIVVDKHAFPVSVRDWSRQSGNRLIQYKDWETCLNYEPYLVKSIEKREKIDADVGKIEFFATKIYQKPNGKRLSSLELGSNKVAQVAAAVVQGAQMNAGLILIIAIGLAGLMGGALLGYFGLPALTGQHLVANPPG